MTDAKKCQGQNAKGEDCALDALPGEEFCRHHVDQGAEPETAVEDDPPAEAFDPGEEADEDGPQETTVAEPMEKTGVGPVGTFVGKMWHCGLCSTRYPRDRELVRRNHIKRTHRLNATE